MVAVKKVCLGTMAVTTRITRLSHVQEESGRKKSLYRGTEGVKVTGIEAVTNGCVTAHPVLVTR